MAAKKRKVAGRSHLENESKIYRIPRFIDESEVLSLTNQGWYIGRRRLKQEEVAALKAEARDFQKSILWQMMRRDIHYVAYLQATAKRHTEMDAIFAGAMYKDLEILEKFIKQCIAL